MSATADPATDRTAIADVLLQYGWAIDDFDWAMLAGLFTDDAVAQYSAYEPLTGGQAVSGFLRDRCVGIVWHQHQVTPMRVEIDGETATTLSYFTAHAIREREPDVVVINVGEYRDRLRRTPDGWRIYERRQQTRWKERRDRSAEDRAEIIALTTAYTWAIDGRDLERLRDVFTPDATGDLRGECNGVDEIIARVSGTQRFDVTQHLIGNHQVVVTGDTATCRCHVQAQHTKRGFPGGENFVIGGTYHDQLVRTPAGWRIAHRRLEALWSDGNPEVLKK